MIRRGTPQLAGIGDGLGADGPDADTLPDAVAVGSPADNAFSFPKTRDPVQGNGCALGSLGGQQSDAARVMLRLTPSPTLELNFAADYSNQNDEPPIEQVLTRRGGFIDNFYSNNVVFPRYGITYTADNRFVTGDPYTNYAGYGDIVNGKVYDTDQTLDAWGISGELDYDISEKLHLKFVTAYRTYESKWISDSDLTPFGLIQTDYLQEHLQRQAEVQLSGLLAGDRLEWTAGAFFYNSRSRAYNTTNFEGFAILGILPNFVADDGYTSENKSGFVHVNYKLTDRMSVSGGVRYTDEKKTNTFNHIGQITVLDPLKFGDSRTDYKLGVDFKMGDDAFLYGQIATGFRSPGSNPRISTPGQLQSISGEEVINYELGAKFDFLDRRLRLNTAVFYADYDPRLFLALATQCNVASDPDPGEPFFLAGGNCPAGTPLAGTVGISPWFVYRSVPGTVKGFEAEASFRPIDNLAINYSAGYNQTRVDAAVGQIGFQDDSVIGQPEWNMSAGIQYGIPLGSAGRLTPRLDAFYQSNRTNGPVTLPQREPDWIVPSYTIYNARISYDRTDSDWQIALSATNLFDKFYYQQLGAATTAAGVPTDGRVGTPGRPREWAISFRKNFN
jgi:iron complex outermembrane receptor protein